MSTALVDSTVVQGTPNIESNTPVRECTVQYIVPELAPRIACINVSCLLKAPKDLTTRVSRRARDVMWQVSSPAIAFRIRRTHCDRD
jgi:hypothetical protein